MPLAFGFANLAALGWLAAAAAPILIHLWMRQTRRETTWAAVRFLRAALERQARKLRLQHLILLAVRTAILVLVALAAAKPFFDSGPLAGVGGAPTHRVLVFDTSLSMQYTADAGGDREGVSRLTAARRLARDLVSGAPAGDVFSVVAMGAEPTTLLAAPAAAGPAVERAIERAEPTDAAADVEAALAHVATLLDQTPAPASVGRRREVVFFSDLDATGWSSLASASDAGAGGGRETYDRLADTAALSVIDVSVDDAANAAVTRVALDDAAPTSGRPIAITAEATLFGGERRETVAQLIVDGQQVAERSVALRRDRPTPIEFAHAFVSPGQHAVNVKLDGDALAADDRGWLALDLRERIRVLCVEGARGAARYLADALDPYAEAADAGSGGPYEPLVVSDADLASVDFNNFDCVIFSNVAELGRDEAARLERYLSAGGGAVFFLGDRVDAGRYNEVLGSKHTGGGALGAQSAPGESRAEPRIRLVRFGNDASPTLLRTRLGDAVTAKSYGVDPLEYAHPIAAPFRGRQRAGLLTTPIARYFELIVGEAADGEAAPEVALALGNGAPLVVTESALGGRIAIVATAASLASLDPATGEPWTAMPAWPSFLPIVRGLVRYATSATIGVEGVRVGAPLAGRIATGAGSNPSLRVERPDGGEATTPVSLKGEWAYAGTDRAGVYRLWNDGQPVAVEAVNSDPAESRLRRVAADRLPPSLAIRRVADPAGSSGGANADPASLHRLLLQAALALVLVDTALACWFGRGGGV